MTTATESFLAALQRHTRDVVNGSAIALQNWQAIDADANDVAEAMEAREVPLPENESSGFGYVIAMVLGFAVTSVLISYLAGGVHEQARLANERNEIIDSALAERDGWKHKYESLSHETDWLTVVDAEAKAQGGNR